MAVYLAQSSLVTLRIDFPEKLGEGQALKLFRRIDGYMRTLKHGIRTDSCFSSVTVAGVLLDEAGKVISAIQKIIAEI